MNTPSYVAHINTQELIEAMPEMKAAKAEIENLGKTYDFQLQELAKEYDDTVKQYDAEVSTVTDEENQRRIEEVEAMRNSIGQYQANAQQDLQKKEYELLNPIANKAKAAILQVARAQGIHYVLDSTDGQGVILADGKDLMADVRIALGF